MHPYERLLLKELAKFDTSSIPADKVFRRGYAVSLRTDDSMSAKTAVFCLVDTLRASKLLKGRAANVKMSDLENMKGGIELGDNAALIQDNTVPGGGMRLSLLFADDTPAEVHTKIIGILGALEKDANKPSPLLLAKDAMKSTFAAGGLPAKTVEAISNDIVLTFGKAKPFQEKQEEIFKAMYDAGLLKFDDVRSSPVIYLNKEENVTCHIPFPNKSVQEVQNGLLAAEILIRRRAEGTPWQQRAAKSTFVSGEGLRRQ